MLCIRKMREEDIAEAARMEREIFPDPWSERAIRETLAQKQTMLLAALENGRLIGYLILYYVLEDAEITRVAVDTAWRRGGIGRQLLKETALFCEENGVKKLLLDVRESNASARAFYERLGFVQDGIRKNYYTDPVENAILMSLELL